MRKALVYYNNEEAGTLIENDDRTFVFSYTDIYFSNVNKPMISLTLPKTKQEYYSSQLFPFFFNLIAEGANLSLQSRYLKMDKRDYFGILCATACYDTIGAVTVKMVE